MVPLGGCCPPLLTSNLTWHVITHPVPSCLWELVRLSLSHLPLWFLHGLLSYCLLPFPSLSPSKAMTWLELSSGGLVTQMRRSWTFLMESREQRLLDLTGSHCCEVEVGERIWHIITPSVQMGDLVFLRIWESTSHGCDEQLLWYWSGCSHSSGLP